MTVEVEEAIISYAGNGTSAPLPVPFRFLDAAHLRITSIDAALNETRLVRGSDYSVSGAGAAEGGVVTPLAAVAIGVTWRIDRVTPQEQPTEFSEGYYSAKAHETALDRQMLALQEVSRDTVDVRARALQVPRGETAAPLPKASRRRNALLAFDDNGTAFPLSLTPPITYTLGVQHKDSRAALAQAQTTPATAYLSEAGREGNFVWVDANLSAQVTADEAQGLYVAPEFDGTGTSGAWVRQYEGPVALKWFGAAEDGTSNDSGYILIASRFAEEIRIDGECYAPDLQIRDSINLRFVGDGKLKSSWRKSVVRQASPSDYLYSNDLTPVHLSHFLSVVGPKKVVIVGDSLAGLFANSWSRGDMISGVWEAELKNAFGSDIEWANRAVGGTTIANFLTNMYQPYIVWYQGHPGDDWVDRVAAEEPDLIIFNWGMNYSDPQTFYITHLDQAIDWVLDTDHFPKTPSMIAMTAALPSPRSIPYPQGQGGQQARDEASGAIRTYAKWKGDGKILGLVDIHRKFCMARDGIDPVSSCISRVGTPFVASTGTVVQGTTLCTDWKSRPLSNFGLMAVNESLTFKTGAGNNDFATLVKTSNSTMEVALYCGGDFDSLALYSQQITLNTTTGEQFGLAVEKVGNRLRIYLDNDPYYGTWTDAIFEGPVVALGGTYYPLVTVSNTRPLALKGAEFWYGLPRLNTPSIRDYDLYGQGETVIGPEGGSDFNHPGGRFATHILRSMIAQAVAVMMTSYASYQNRADLSASDGATMVGTPNGPVQGELDRLQTVTSMTRAQLVAQPATRWGAGQVVYADGLAYQRVASATVISDLPGWYPYPERRWNLCHWPAKAYDNTHDNGAILQQAFNLAQLKRIADKGCGGLVIDIDPGEWWFATKATCNISPSGSISTGVGESGILVRGAGEAETCIVAHSTNTDGCIRLTSQRNSEIKACTDMTFLSDLDRDAVTNNGIALQIDAQLNSGDAGYGDHPKWSAIIERCVFAGYGVSAGNLANRGNWLKGAELSNKWYPRIRDLRVLGRYASAETGRTACTHGVHLRDCYSPDIDGFYGHGGWQHHLWIEAEDGSPEDCRLLNIFSVGALDGVGVVHPADTGLTLYEPGGVIDTIHANSQRFGITIRGHRQLQISNLYGYLSTAAEAVIAGELLPAVVLLDAVGDIRVSGQFLEPGFYTSNGNASVAVRIEGSSEAVLVQAQFGGDGIGVLNNSTATSKSIAVYADLITSRRSGAWTNVLKTVVDNVGGVMLRENRLAGTVDRTVFVNSKSNGASYPNAVRVGSSLIGQLQCGAFEIAGVDAAGGEIIAGIVRGRITNNTAGAEASTLDGFVRYQGTAHLAFSFDPVTTAGQTSLSLETKLGSTVVAKRTYLTADGTGPGGVGSFMCIGASPAGTIPDPSVVLTSGASYSVASGIKTVVVRKVSASATVVTLPASPFAGQVVIVKDGKGDAATNSITISPATGTIDGAASLVISTNRGSARLAYDGTEWVVL